MRKTITVRKRKIHFSTFKVRDAYGLCSGKNSKLGRGRSHFLLMDFDLDNPILFNTVKWNLRARFPTTKITIYKTRGGFHAIVWKRFSFRKAVIELIKTPFIDLNHVAIGIKRGYWFLETLVLVTAPFNLRPLYMKIERACKEVKETLGS